MLNLSSVVSFGLPNRLAKLLIASIPLGEITDGGLEQVYSTIVWSMSRMFKGLWPSTDEHDRPWGRYSWRYKKQGQLCGPFRFVIVETLGDMKWIKEAFRLPHNYNKVECCHHCRATRDLVPETTIASVMSHSTFGGSRTHDEYMAHATAGGHVAPALTRIDGWHLSTLLPDYMHIIPLGIAQTIVASSMLELCGEGRFGYIDTRNAKLRIALQLQTAYCRFFKWARDLGFEHPQPLLKLNAFCAPKADAAPLSKGKSHNTTVVVCWLSSLHPLHSRPGHDQLRGVLLRSLARQWRLLHAHVVWFDAKQRDAFCRDTRRILLACKALWIEARLEGVRSWGLKPKHHALFHLLKRVEQTSRNPASFWCFSDERFVGDVKMLTPGMKPGRSAASKRALQRHFIATKLRLHRRA